MSKIGRKPIDIANLQVEFTNGEVRYKGPKAEGVYRLPKELSVRIEGNKLFLEAAEEAKKRKLRDFNRIWGLHRALLANALTGAQKEFETLIEINGLGYKAVVSGDKVVFSLGYSHKIDFPLPKNVSVSVDKTGQKVTVKSFDKNLVGSVCSRMKALRMPEPYKGTGIKLASEQIIRKAGKTKS